MDLKVKKGVIVATVVTVVFALLLYLIVFVRQS